MLKVFGSGAQHRRSTDIDVLDQFLESDIRALGSLLKCVQIHHHHIDRGDVVFGDRFAMRSIVANVQNAAVDFRMKSFHAAIEHLGKAGQLGDVLHLSSSLA